MYELSRGHVGPHGASNGLRAGPECLIILSSSSANCIQRMRRTPPLDELQPPPYQDENGSPRMSCTLSDLGDAKCDLSHTSGSPHLSFSKCPSEGSDDRDAGGYFNKGYEEDVPSDSTAVLSPEVRAGAAARGGRRTRADLLSPSGHVGRRVGGPPP